MTMQALLNALDIRDMLDRPDVTGWTRDPNREVLRVYMANSRQVDVPEVDLMRARTRIEASAILADALIER